MTDWLNRCHVGDCRAVLPTLPHQFADCAIIDPPYGDTSLDWDRRCAGWLGPVARALKPASSFWLFGSMRFLMSVGAEIEGVGFKYAQDIVWEKQNGTGFHADRLRRVHEHAVQFYRGAWRDVYRNPQYTYDARAKVVRRKTRPTHTGHIDVGHYVSVDGGPRLQRSVMKVRNEHGKALHPTQKPLGVLVPLIAYSTPRGGIVLDPFFGSGSTAVAAVQIDRNWCGVELNPKYEHTGIERLRQQQIYLEHQP